MQFGKKKKTLKHRTHGNRVNRTVLLNMNALGLDSQQTLLNPTEAETEPK